MSHEQMKSETMNGKNRYGRSLIVCPSSVVGHWVNEIMRIDPDRNFLTPLRYVGSSRHDAWEKSFDGANIVITRYALTFKAIVYTTILFHGIAQIIIQNSTLL